MNRKNDCMKIESNKALITMVHLKFMSAGAIFLFLLFFLLPPAIQGQRRAPIMTEIQGHTLYTILSPGDIPAIFDPEFIPVSEAGRLYYDQEPLMVVVAEGAAKAYSTWHLDRHEVVNDVIGGTLIAATW